RILLINKSWFEGLYNLYNSRQWVHPDPLEFLYNYSDSRDIDIAGLIASSLAYGRVAQILKSVSGVLEEMGPSPYEFLFSTTPSSLRGIFSGFKHRFTTGDELARMLIGARSVIGQYGSLYKCFLAGFNDHDDTVLNGLSFLVHALRKESNGKKNSLWALPWKGSACKRWNLYLRWMVREDRVDTGGWTGISPAKLIIPLDTHMHRICLLMGLTERKNADMRTALDITAAFRKIEPNDPVRYDFALTRLGMRDNTNLDAFLNRCYVGTEAKKEIC
ncbi:MAG: TIGR02757 family protein, partial [Thermodesulfobacteriota bacterium]|nr:TIGR02757 family protein [Thermodesulfobacteriota bacterium]